MTINSLGINLNRRKWLKMATGAVALALAAPQVNLGQLHAQEANALTKEAIRINNETKIPFDDSVVSLFKVPIENPDEFIRKENRKPFLGERNQNTLQRTGNGRDILYEILRNTTKESWSQKTLGSVGREDLDYILTLRELANYVLDAENPNRPGALNDNVFVQNLRKKNSVKVNLDEIVDFGINVKSAWLGALTAYAIAAGWSHLNLPTALEIINKTLETFDYETASYGLRRNIERVVASKMFGETEADAIYYAAKYHREDPNSPNDWLPVKYQAEGTFERLSKALPDREVLNQGGRNLLNIRLKYNLSTLSKSD